MHLASTQFLLAVTVTSVTADVVQSVDTFAAASVTRHVRDTAIRYGRQARSAALEQIRYRHLSGNMDFDLDNFDLSAIGPFICPLLELMEDIPDELEGVNVSCNFGCDDTSENIVVACDIPDQLCDWDGEFCVKDTTVEMTMSTSFDNVLTNTCMTYVTVPAEYDQLADEELCVSVDVDIDIDSLEEVADDNIVKIVTDVVQVTDCGVTLAGDNCKCEICDGAMGIDIQCLNGFASEKCIDVDVSEIANGSFSAPDAIGSTVSFIRLTKEVDGTSTAGVLSSIAATALTILAFTSLLL